MKSWNRLILTIGDSEFEVEVLEENRAQNFIVVLCANLVLYLFFNKKAKIEAMVESKGDEDC